MCTALSVPLHFFWCYYFAIYLDLELTGIGIAGAISFGLQLLFINLYTYHSKDIKFTVSIYDPRIYQKDEFNEFLNLAIPSVLMFWINWWIWEVMLLVSGLISVDDQATQVITMNVYSFFMMGAHGFN